MWSPAPASVANVRNSAAWPLAVATAPSPPSRLASRSSSAATVGLRDAAVDLPYFCSANRLAASVVSSKTKLVVW